MIPTRIFLDLDDVCNTFTPYALRSVGCPVDVLSFDDCDPLWGYDIVAAANTLHPSRTFTLSSFWESIGRSVWATVPESAEFTLLLRWCEECVGTENVCILTSPTIDPDCLAGKLEWIHCHLPKRMHRQFLIGPTKHLCARPDALLIDDHEKNVNLFRQHGGQAILVPRPWNSLFRVRDTLNYLLIELGNKFCLRQHEQHRSFLMKILDSIASYRRASQ